jgi:hypothetical protein
MSYTAPGSKRIAYLLYLAGVEVPCLDVNAQFTVGTENQAIVTIPPHPIMADFGEGDKVQAAIFYLDSWYYKDTPKWCLLYEGYVAGCDYTVTPTKKEISLTIKSNLSVLNGLYLEFLGGGDLSSGKAAGKAGKVIPNQITFKGKYPGRLFTIGLEDKAQIRTPYEFFQNIVLATTGKYKDKDIAPDGTKKQVGEEIKRITSVVRLNYETKLASTPDDLKEKFKADELAKITAKLRSLGVSDTPSNVADAQDKLIQQSIKKITDTRSLTDRTPVATGFFSRYCNITKLHKHVAASPIIEGFVGELIDNKYKTKGMPTGVFPILRTKNGSNYAKGLARQTGYKYGDNGSALALLTNMFTVFNYSMQCIPAPPAYDTDDRGLPSGKFSKSSNSSIVSYITKPDTSYSMPPACNIIMPCIRTTVQYSNNFDSRPTRVYYNKISQLRKLNTEQKLGTGYSSLDSQVGYPAAIARHAYDSTDTLKSGMEVLVFPEEYFAGPKTVYKELNPLLSELDRLEKAGRLHDLPGSIKSSEFVDYKAIPANQAAYLRDAFIKADSKDQKNYEVFLRQAQLDYEYMRSSTSTCTVTMPFNPYIIPGYSAVILDSEDTNNHIIGQVAGISHSLSQQSSSTTVSLTAARSLKHTINKALLDGGKYHISPAEPITEVRSVLQDRNAANFYYGNAIYRDTMDKIEVGNTSNLAKLSSIVQEITAEINDITDTLDSIEDANIEQASKLAPLQQRLDKAKADLDAELSKSSSDSTTFKAVGDFTKLVALRDYYTGKITTIHDWPTSKEGIAKLITSMQTSELIVYPEVSDLVNTYDFAMDYCSRPVCTMDQYIDFYASQQDLLAESLVGGRGKGCRIGKQTIDSNSTDQAYYWKIIREFVGGPGIEPGAKTSSSSHTTSIQSSKPISAKEVEAEIKKAEEISNAVSSPALTLYYISEGENNTAETKAFAVVDGEASFTQLPDLAKDWQSLLLLYSELLRR